MSTLLANPGAEPETPVRERTVVFVAYPQMGLLDLTGAQTVFWAATCRLAQLGLPGYALHTASLHGGPVRSGEGLVVQTRRLDELSDEPIHTLIVPGSASIRQAMLDNAQLVDWLRATSATASRTTSVCSGAFFLAQAGLLDGLRVATHWLMADMFERLFPKVELDREAIFVRQASVWTSAGVSAGIDLALALVEADNGRDLAMQVARRMVVYYRRPDNHEQWSPLLQSQHSIAPERQPETVVMNAPHKLYLVSHSPCVSRYGTHTSLSTAERVEIIDALTQTLGATLGILARLKHSQQTLRAVSFLPMQTLLRRLLNANNRYADFLVTVITDLGGHAQRDALYRLNDAAEPLCFADCLKGIDRALRRLRAADALFRDCRASAIANNDYASRQLFEACNRHNGYFLSLINNHLFPE